MRPSICVYFSAVKHMYLQATNHGRPKCADACAVPAVRSPTTSRRCRAGAQLVSSLYAFTFDAGLHLASNKLQKQFVSILLSLLLVNSHILLVDLMK